MIRNHERKRKGDRERERKIKDEQIWGGRKREREEGEASFGQDDVVNAVYRFCGEWGAGHLAPYFQFHPRAITHPPCAKIFSGFCLIVLCLDFTNLYCMNTEFDQILITIKPPPCAFILSPAQRFYSLLSLPSYHSSALRNLFLWLLPDCFVQCFEPW